MNKHKTIEQAINNRLCLTFTFNGQKRRMSPHVIGFKKRKRQALFYQYGGTSNSKLSIDETQNWRCIPIDQIEDLRISDDPFQTPYNYSVQKQTCINEVEAAISWTPSF